MLTLLFLVPLIILGAVVFALGIAALPIIAVVIAIGLVFSIISIIFKFVFGGPLLIIMIIWAIVHFSKHKTKF
ncbi:hypothetical protein JMF89_07190 [Clostridiaceae bacterium UIB06]|uniref:Phage shock protein G n=1 Tax=Clostridium thailandense TaxID=2794346 RepID=A0A949TL39_9CLOT|nr:hypothetical protein [Clostridium thailandense]MBV7272462.1 hypothetical protein [Clostridium thailandense]MCH5136986.1 hypothetical protein [Clostridiaceae bacterium UIB06]